MHDIKNISLYLSNDTIEESNKRSRDMKHSMATLEVTRNIHGKLVQVIISTPTWSKLTEDNFHLIQIPTFGIELFVEDGSDIDMAISDSIKALITATETAGLGKGFEQELKAFGWEIPQEEAKENQSDDISLEFNTNNELLFDLMHSSQPQELELQLA
jgi:hypothetical protein